MAKSLRAKTKVRMRVIKRGKVFEPVALARTARLSKKLAVAAKLPLPSAASIAPATNAPLTVELNEEDVMEIDTESKSKVSTSGWKGSRNEAWKQKKASKISAMKKQGNRSLVFGKSRKSSKK
ncbi:hypothetical protein V1512DRAFT_258389 [Lipomyces arxii]|uniref:uncharacterized protein n=1 Tax=Lipomyces arxii TaxID=56418 RepID=UPI0034CE7171